MNVGFPESQTYLLRTNLAIVDQYSQYPLLSVSRQRQTLAPISLPPLVTRALVPHLRVHDNVHRRRV